MAEIIVSTAADRVPATRTPASTGAAPAASTTPILNGKFVDPDRTAEGKPRARVALRNLRTLWFNTGTLCNLTCQNCYIESSPSNDRLVYLSSSEVKTYLDEAATLGLGTQEIGFTGGEPFMNPDILAMLEDSLAAGFRVLVLTNAMRPMMKCGEGLLALLDRYGERLVLRVSIDHFRPELHEQERGRRSWAPTIDGLRWLSDHGFALRVAGRLRWGDGEGALRDGFNALFQAEGIKVDAYSPEALVLFPEMDETADTPEISAECWDLLGVRPEDMMCASSRMVIRRNGAAAPEVVSCTLLPYTTAFCLGSRLADSLGEVSLNHPHCSRFCVLGGGRCAN